MDSVQDKLFQSLEADQILGPEHHRFKLVKQGKKHPLGQLWFAEDTAVSGNPLVTLLIILPKLLKNKAFIENIKKQVALHKQLKNKHIATCYGFFAHKGGLLFIAYEKLDGLTLNNLLEKKEPLPDNKLQTLLKQIAYAVDMGYQKLHMPHATLEPSAVFINRKGGVKLQHFCLRESINDLTSLLNQPVSYPQYQSPEAFHPGKLNRKTDVYSFACIIYQMITGTPPFNEKDSEADRVRRELEKPSTLSGDQWEQLQKAFSTDSEERFATLSDLLRAVFPEDLKTPSSDEEAAEDKPSEEKTDPGEDGDSEDSEEENKPSLLSRLKGMIPTIPRALLYSLAGAGLFITGYLLGWFVSEFVNFKEKDFQTLQIAKQQEALTQMYDSLQAQQELQDKREATIKSQQLDLEILQQELAASKSLLKAQEPDSPGTQLFKDQIDENLYGPEMILLPTGDFRMGDQSGQGDDNEKPVHIVHIDHMFALSRFEVTFDQYDLFAKETGRPLPDDGGWGRGNRPVINVSWDDARAYAKWLADMTNQPYRLPTEAEWEYAARATTQNTYWWGNKFKANMAVCSDCGSRWDGRQTAPVGSFAANQWGLHDMTGNVDEWVADCYSENYNQTPVDGSAYRERGCRDRVMRGGSWFEISRLIRPASRYRHPATTSRSSWGFRVALDIKQ